MQSTKKDSRNTLGKYYSYIRAPRFLRRVGLLFLSISLLLAILIFRNVIFYETAYVLKKGTSAHVVELHNPQKSKNTITPKDADFGIVIPKINANAPIVAETDPFDHEIYQEALSKGVAHAKDTAYPSEYGSMFLFAHSSLDFYTASKYNSIFYLIYKLEKGDDIYIFYKGDKYRYRVNNKILVESEEIEYLDSESSKKAVRLMTCWPPGTTHKRLIVEADAVANHP